MQRLKSHRDFVQVLRQRRKVTGKNIVVHYLVRNDAFTLGDGVDEGDDVVDNTVGVERRLGLAVSKAVGNAVVRNAVKRRFRVLAREHEHLLPADCDIVMRAKPSAASASFQSLDRQVGRLFNDIAAKNKASVQRIVSDAQPEIDSRDAPTAEIPVVDMLDMQREQADEVSGADRESR